MFVDVVEADDDLLADSSWPEAVEERKKFEDKSSIQSAMQSS